MRILLDENIDSDLAEFLGGHEVQTVAKAGWRSVKNGELLKLARIHFDALLTMDKGIAHQHNHQGQTLIIGVIRAPNNRIETLSASAPKILSFLSEAQQGTVGSIECQD